MLIETEKKDGLLIARVKEKRLDARVAPMFIDELRPFIDAGVKKIVLNLGKTDFIDSSGLGAIVTILKSMGSHGNIAVSDSTMPVLQLLNMTQMDKIFSIFSTENEAIKSFTFN